MTEKYNKERTEHLDSLHPVCYIIGTVNELYRVFAYIKAKTPEEKAACKVKMIFGMNILVCCLIWSLFRKLKWKQYAPLLCYVYTAINCF